MRTPSLIEVRNVPCASEPENKIQALGSEICYALQMRGQLECMGVCPGMSQDSVNSLYARNLGNLL